MNSEGEEYGYIEEEVEEIPEIDYDTEWTEFGNIKVELDHANTEESSPAQKRKLRNVKKSNKKTIIALKSTKKNSQNIPFSFVSVPESNRANDKKIYESNPEALNTPNSSKLALFEGNALFDGTYFTFIGEYYLKNTLKQTVIRKFKGKCEICEIPSYIVGTGTSTYNFLRHLRRKHGQKIFESYLKYKQAKSSKSKVTDATKILKKISKDGSVTIYTAVGLIWKQFGNPRAKRPFPSVILDDGISDRILSDVHDFILNPSWYHDRSIPYRRTYLLHGPSGCGKSSFVYALASELNYGICVLHTADRELTDDKLNHLLNNTLENCIILLEDIDAILNCKTRGDSAEEPSRLTLNGVANCLDGVTAPEGRIIFITCSDIIKLNPTLLRPGRIDVKEHLGYCSQSQIVQLYEKFYGDSSSAVEFSQEVLKYEQSVSPAQLQGFFLSHKHDDVQCLKQDISQMWNF